MDNNITLAKELFELMQLIQSSNNSDIYSLVLSLSAIIISIFALYFSHFFKSSKAILCLVKQEYPDKRRKLYYTLSNIGNQELYIKHIYMFLKPINISKYPMCKINNIETFIIKPGEIKDFIIIEEIYHKIEDKDLSKIVNINIVSSLGKRYEINHNITNLLSDTQLNDIIYNGITLTKVKTNDNEK